MLLHYYTHSILFWFSLPIVKPNGSFIKNIQEIDFEYLPKEVCIAKCLQTKKMSQMSAVVVSQVETRTFTNNTFLQICRDDCVTLNSTYASNSSSEKVKQIHENYRFDLICRDESSLNFFIDLHTNNKADKATSSNTTTTTSTEPSSSSSAAAAAAVSSILTPSYKNGNEYETVYVITFHPAQGSDKFVVYLSDDNFFTLDNLMSNTTYNISVMAVHSNNQYSVITQQQQFRTLRRSFTPGNVTEIKVINFTEDKHNKMHLSATLTWKPPADKTCHYDIICFSPQILDYEMLPLEIRNPRQLYKYELENLSFSSVYKVGIRSRNTKNMKESELFWKTFQAPSCAEWYNYNFNICAPDTPQNLNIEQTYIEENMYSLNITWQLPTHLPDNYTLRIQDLSPEGRPEIYNLTKEMQYIFIPQIKIHGVFYEVSLTANTRGGQTTTSFTDLTKTIVHFPEKNPFVKLTAIIFAPIFCVAIISLTIFMIYHRRAKLKRYQERCKYFEELEKKAPIDPKDNFDFNKHKSNELQYQLDAEDLTLINDQMEIDRNQLSLHEILGEGAFGLVKRGIYKDIKEGIAYEVAVKMLKDHPSTDDVRAFRREIEVMKSVEKHPNIVGIIGHCTSYGNEMMLLTEYCSFGNLLNFLRDEWRFLHELQQKKQTLTTGIVDVELPQVPEQLSRRLHTHFKYDSSHKIASPHTINGGDYNDDFNTNDEILEHFKKKYNIFSGTAITTASAAAAAADPATTRLTNCTINNKFRVWQDVLQHVEVLNKSATTTTNSSPHYIKQNDGTTTTTHVTNNQRTAMQTTVFSPAAENKSYGYHNCCTNSCKCDVDVVIRNIDSSDSSKDNEELDRLLLLQQHHNQQQQQSTTIEVKNCNCKMKEQQFHYPNQKQHLQQIEQQRQQQQPKNDSNQLVSAVENKTYFKIFQKSTPSSIGKVKTKPPPLSLPSPPLPVASQPTSAATMNSEWAETLSRVPLSSGDLLDIARQVAVGMNFLAKNKVVHRDLAARNVLVSPDRTVKIADFGLSRDVYQENMYKKTGNGKLPIKWLALESMTHQVYTTQSDVWSYGILLYEIVTLGATPYPSIPTNRLLHLLKTGYRMEKPKNCGNEFYDLMSACWNGVPNDRPTFNEIIKKLDNMLNNFNNATTLLPNEGYYINDDNNLSNQESPIQQICSDDSYLKPL